MIRRGIHLLLSGTLTILCLTAVQAAETRAASLDFNEIYNLIKTNAPGVSDAELNRAAVQGMVSSLAPKVSLVSNAVDHSEEPSVAKVTLFDKIVYLRISTVSDGLAKAVADAYRAVNATNATVGVVLDLRYTAGFDYSAAAATADLFSAKATPMLNWGYGVVSSRQKTNAITDPVAVIVNHDTAGAAEALAAAVREVDAGLILGSRTAGRAAITKDFPLKNGESLRVATAPVLLGNGNPLAPNGVTPDIDVTVSVEDEKSFYADAFLVKTNDLASLSSTNQPSGTNQASHRLHFNEAELVRARKQGIDLDAMEDGAFSSRETRLETPVVRDPALARALDLLKGLAVVRQSRS